MEDQNIRYLEVRADRMKLGTRKIHLWIRGRDFSVSDRPTVVAGGLKWERVHPDKELCTLLLDRSTAQRLLDDLCECCGLRPTEEKKYTPLGCEMPQGPHVVWTTSEAGATAILSDSIKHLESLITDLSTEIIMPSSNVRKGYLEWKAINLKESIVSLKNILKHLHPRFPKYLDGEKATDTPD